MVFRKYVLNRMHCLFYFLEAIVNLAFSALNIIALEHYGGAKPV